ncbi:MAG: hypothetical protein GKR94_19095 [Gammaproteobacteria bacterium]|nr:hypothetical protein [Gammaproteobacteria bacterium]
MHFDPPLEQGVLRRRYKRFLAGVEYGAEVSTVRCPNTGSMLGCSDPGAKVGLHRLANPKRKYSFTWEWVEVAGGVVVGVNTGRGTKHLRELTALAEEGKARAVMIDCVQHQDVREVHPVDEIESLYAKTLRVVLAAVGVAVYALRAAPAAHGIFLDTVIPVVVPQGFWPQGFLL